jgi:hypothetical protein
MTDLEALLVADEDARARLDALRAEQATRIDATRAEYAARRHSQIDALTTAFDAEVAGLAGDADAEIARRELARRERIASVEARAAVLVEPGSAIWVRIVEEGDVP